MARDADVDSAPPGAQSKRPSLSHRESDSHSDTTNTAAAPAPPHRTKHHHQKHHHVGRLHARVPSSKAVYKQPAVGHGPAAPKLTRRPPSPSDPDSIPQRPSHRRVASEAKLPSRSSTLSLSKSASHTSLKRNRSHVEVSKRNRSSDKLKRTSSGTGIHRPKSSKSQVHFDLGSDDPEDEWVDASGSNSPYLSRKGSLNSSAQSSLRPGGSALHSRPETPNEPARARAPSSPDRETSHHKEYLTSRLLQRTPSHGAPPKMTADFAQAARPHLSPSPNSTDPNVSPPLGSNQDELISRFVDVSGSGLTSQGSFYRPRGGARPSDEIPRRPNSIATLTPSRDLVDTAPSTDNEDSVLVPRTARRSGDPPAESRIQQKLNLQRASSVLEPGQAVSGVGGVVGATPLIGVGGSGFDGGSSRDPRVGKLLERTGMEYLVVRRYQNPVSRSLSRLGRTPGLDKSRRIPRSSTPLMNGKRSTEPASRHTRNVSMPDTRHAATARRSASIRTVGTGSSFEGDDVSRLNERLSGASLVGAEEESGTTTLLRNLWERPMDLGASTD
ncbi:hypothetical protein CDD83_1054 [Cordyceps sp. RAO-2017]|nr:hypothetical protein CDD83_1054 [Cordyceps sp. RAO-2017]